MKKKLKWLRLDNAAKIYPAAMRKNWSNVFRLSVTLLEDVDCDVLQSALELTAPRFPSIAARLRRGIFWYYLQQLPSAPELTQERSWPLCHMDRREMRRSALRVIVYKNRIAVEFFHSLTDGTGALVFLKTLTAEYLEQKYGVSIPAENGVLDRQQTPSPGELEDSFLKHAGPAAASRRGKNAWRLSSRREDVQALNLVCFRLPVKDTLELAHKYQVSLTVFLSAVMMGALLEMQKEKIRKPHRRKPIKLLIPVNLRQIFPSETLRNFAMYIIPELDPRLGEYELEEICGIINHKMAMELNAKYMGSMIATNVNDERNPFVRLIPLPIKNMVMRAIFDSVGERQSCLSLSNLGAVRIPEPMEQYVRRFDFILGPQAAAPYNCGVISYGDTVCINFIRNICQPELERHFFRLLQNLGLSVTVESNGN